MYQTEVETFHPLWMVATLAKQPQHSISFALTSALRQSASASSQLQQRELHVNSAGAAAKAAAPHLFCFEAVNRSHKSKFA